MAAVMAALTCPVQAASVHTAVTPRNLTTLPAVGFRVTTRDVGGGVEYEVVITRKELDPVRFEKRMGGGLVRVTQTASSFGFESVRPANPEPLGPGQIRYRFTATAAEVGRLSFEIGFPVYTTVGGKRVWMPSADFYYLDLKDFAPRGPRQ